MNQNVFPPPDDDLERMIRSSLRDGLDAPVTRDLAAGARRRARVIKRRRAGAGMAGLASVVAAIIVVPQTFSPTSEPAASSSPSITSTPTAPPTASPTTATAPLTIPPTLRLRAEDLSAPVVEELDIEARNTPVVSGQMCANLDDNGMPIEGIQSMWAKVPVQFASTTLVVTLWKDPQTALDQTIADTGPCRFGSEPVTLRADTDPKGRPRAVGSGTINTLNYGFSITRVGPALVAITVDEREQDATLAQVQAEAERVGVILADRADETW